MVSEFLAASPSMLIAPVERRLLRVAPVQSRSQRFLTIVSQVLDGPGIHRYPANFQQSYPYSHSMMIFMLEPSAALASFSIAIGRGRPACAAYPGQGTILHAADLVAFTGGLHIVLPGFRLNALCSHNLLLRREVGWALASVRLAIPSSLFHRVIVALWHFDRYRPSIFAKRVR